MMLLESRLPVWQRLKSENHQFYKAVLASGLRDNTLTPRYASHGRWSALAYVLSGDPAFAQRSFDHLKSRDAKGDFATIPPLTSNDFREHGTELIQTLMWIKPGIAESDWNQFRDWLIRTADQVVKDGVRVNDSDQTTGTHFFIALLDQQLGTDYTSKQIKNPTNNAIPLFMWELRDKVRQFCLEFADGGMWPESSDYNLGTTYLLFNGAELVGMDKYPDVAEFRAEFTKQLIHSFVPGLKDTFEWGDEQTPHNPVWHSLEDLLAYLGNFSPEMRGFEKDYRALKDHPEGEPFYPRYFVWADPYRPSADWQSFAGKSHLAPGTGQIHARTGWTADDAGLWAWFPSFSKGEVDHTHHSFGDMRFWDHGWKIDHPIAYSSSVLLPNHTLLAGQGASKEVGLLTGHRFIDGKVTYVTGINAGADVATKHYNPPATFRHELAPSIFWFPDRQVIVTLLRVHLDDPKTLPGFASYPAATQTKMAASPLIQTLWHSNVKPTVAGGVIQGNQSIQPLYPATFTIVDEAPLSLGTIEAKEKAWRVDVVPAVVKPFQILATVHGECDSATAEIVGNLHRVVVKKAGFPDAVIYSSATPGPKLLTSKLGPAAIHDPSKIVGILAARTITADIPAEAGDVFIERTDTLEYRPFVKVPPPPPSPVLAYRIAEGSTDNRITLERVP